jgi:hypothetical protein
MVIEPPMASTAGSNTPVAASKAITMILQVDIHVTHVATASLAKEIAE